MRTTASLLAVALLSPARGWTQDPIVDPYAAGMAFYWANEMDSAVVYLETAARESATDAERWAWLAEAQRRAGRIADAAATARAALVLATTSGRCSAFAHAVLAAALSPQYSRWEGVDAELTWSHLLAATACDPDDGNAWLQLVFDAARHGDRELERRALERLVETGFFTPAVLTYNRWVLRGLPDSAVLITNGDMDTYPALALQAVDSLRTDVAVINVSLLNIAWYQDTVVARHGLPPPTVQRGDAAVGTWAPRVAAAWVRASLAGHLPRPVAFAPTIAADVFDDLPGMVQYAGTHWLAVPRLSASRDTTALQMALAGIDPAQWRGPAVSGRDRSPVRRGVEGSVALIPILTAVRYGCALEVLGDGDGVRRIAEWIRDYVRDAEIEHGWADAVLETITEGFPTDEPWCRS